MSKKNLDGQGRWRSKTIAFRISPEENLLLERHVRLSGLSKQEYITSRMLAREITVIGNPRVYKALKNELAAVLTELKHIEPDENPSADLLAGISMLAAAMDGMKGGRRE